MSDGSHHAAPFPLSLQASSEPGSLDHDDVCSSFQAVKVTQLVGPAAALSGSRAVSAIAASSAAPTSRMSTTRSLLARLQEPFEPREPLPIGLRRGRRGRMIHALRGLEYVEHRAIFSSSSRRET